MPRISFDRSDLPQASLVFLATFASLALLAWVLAYWSWVWLLPRAAHRGDGATSVAAASAPVAELFGQLQRTGGATPATGLALRLQGVAAATGSDRGYAIVQIDAKRVVAAMAGDELAPGIRLAEVHADHVVLERSGLRETLSWPPKGAAAAPAPANR